jgi:glycosyltransferase involved in cell wall biosynthesis
VPDVSARVGVVLRTKNRPWFLARAIRDIAAQSFGSWAVAVVDDGGNPSVVDDAVAALAEGVRERFSVRHNATPHGRSVAANEGVAMLDTEFVVLHDDDDLWHADFLARTVEHLDADPADAAVVTRTEIVYEAAKGDDFVEVGRAPFWPGLSAFTFSDLLQVNRAVPIGVLYRRALHEELGGYREDLHAAEDWEFYLRVTLAHRVGFIDGTPLAYWMQRRDVEGEAGNSMFALAGEHERYDRMVRDEALRVYVAEHGAGLPLYLSKYIQDEVARQLDERRSLGQRLTGALRDWRRDRRMR